jgi:hypothetical protein
MPARQRHERINRDVVSSVERGGHPRLRGRDSEIEMLLRRHEELIRGRGGVVLIRGAAGLGKSTLLAEAEAMARRRGARVYHGASAVAGQSLPLGPLLDALMDADDPPVDAAVLRELSGSADRRYWLLRELEERLERAAMAGPMAIGLDDIQWADAATLNAITVLPRRLASHPILWLLVVRSGELAPPAQLAVARVREENADILTLGPLSDDAVGDVIRNFRSCRQPRCTPMLSLPMTTPSPMKRLPATRGVRNRYYGPAHSKTPGVSVPRINETAPLRGWTLHSSFTPVPGPSGTLPASEACCGSVGFGVRW